MKTLVQCDPVDVGGIKPEIGARVAVADDVMDLDRLTLTVAEDYYTRFRRPRFVTDSVSASTYLSSESPEFSGQSLLCQEMPIPRHLLSSVTLSLPRGATWTPHAIGYIHAGRRGCMTPLHFDWDVSWVAHVCLTGRKVLSIFPPNAGWLLSPVLNLSALCVPKFSETDRSELARRLGGVEVVLNAGEGLLFPSLSWHGVFYEEHSLSMSVRFEPNVGGRPFAALPRSWLLQRLVWRFFCEDYDSGAHDFLTEYMKIFFNEDLSWKQRYRRVQMLCGEALLDLGEAQGAEVFVGENFSAELALAGDAVKHYYTIAPRKSSDLAPEDVKDALNYIFEGIRVPQGAERLAGHALRQRQGLRPRRGLVDIEIQ